MKPKIKYFIFAALFFLLAIGAIIISMMIPIFQSWILESVANLLIWIVGVIVWDVCLFAPIAYFMQESMKA